MLTNFQLGVLHSIEPRNNSKFINELLPMIFSINTLCSSSITGRKCVNFLDASPKPKLDPEKLRIVKGENHYHYIIFN
jgi:hypothetical protein